MTSQQLLHGSPQVDHPDILSVRMESNASKLYKPPLPTVIPDLSTKSMDQKIDVLIALAQGQNRSIITLSQDMTTVVGDIHSIKENKVDNVTIKYELQEASGKIARLEQQEERLHKKISVLEQREHRKSIVLYNVEEHGTQSNKVLSDAVYKFIENVLEIDSENVFSKYNTSGEIRIDSIQRLGKPNSDPKKPRPILVQFLTGMGRDLVYNRVSLANVRSNGTKIRMAEQYIPEIREKRTAQRPLFVEYKNHYKDTQTKVNLVYDQILIDKKTIKSLFEENPLPAKTALILPYDNMTHSDPIGQNGSQFQGHIVKINSKDQATAARNSIFQKYTNEHHIMYAYTIKSSNKPILKGHSDDFEVSGSKKLIDYINEELLSNVFLCVTRIKNGPNIGAIRFDLIEEAAKSAKAKLDETIEPVFLLK